jgi:hypothetical protein
MLDSRLRGNDVLYLLSSFSAFPFFRFPRFDPCLRNHRFPEIKKPLFLAASYFFQYNQNLAVFWSLVKRKNDRYV